MYSNEPGLIPINGYNIFETPKSVKVILELKERKTQIWVPKSVCEDWPDVGESGEFLIQDWWLGKEGLI